MGALLDDACGGPSVTMYEMTSDCAIISAMENNVRNCVILTSNAAHVRTPLEIGNSQSQS